MFRKINTLETAELRSTCAKLLCPKRWACSRRCSSAPTSSGAASCLDAAVQLPVHSITAQALTPNRTGVSHFAPAGVSALLSSAVRELLVAGGFLGSRQEGAVEGGVHAVDHRRPAEGQKRKQDKS